MNHELTLDYFTKYRIWSYFNVNPINDNSKYDDSETGICIHQLGELIDNVGTLIFTKPQTHFYDNYHSFRINEALFLLRLMLSQDSVNTIKYLAAHDTEIPLSSLMYLLSRINYSYLLSYIIQRNAIQYRKDIITNGPPAIDLKYGIEKSDSPFSIDTGII